jgi:selenocysteine lyase/cysteine desulfurase
LATVIRVPSQPFDTFGERIRTAATSQKTDLVFLSHVFFNSGAIVPDVQALVASLPADPLVVVDGYHGFLAVPTDWSSVAGRAFYMAGGYKYAMAGEGACFLHVPPSAPNRPVNTGWFAGFGTLQQTAAALPYATDGGRFLGSTFDPSGLYRFNAVMQWRQRLGLTTAASREHVQALQAQFTQGLDSRLIGVEQLMVRGTQRGQFLTFQTPAARAVCEALKLVNVITDVRDDRLRFGFGIAQNTELVAQLLERVAALR